jgi:hypothetical protein
MLGHQFLWKFFQESKSSFGTLCLGHRGCMAE